MTKSAVVLLCLCIINLSLAQNVSEEFQNSSLQFTLDFYQEFSKNKMSNFLLSPFSVETLLAWLNLGANEQTSEEINKAIYLSNDQNTTTQEILEDILPTFKETETYLCQNMIFINESYEIEQDFVATSEYLFEDGLQQISFINATETINEWASNQTLNKITDLFKPNDLNDQTISVILSLPYLSGNWSTQFNLAKTKKRAFWVTRTRKILVETMNHQNKPFKYFNCPILGAQFLELPFEGNDTVMVIVLPNVMTGLPKLEMNLKRVLATHKKLQEVLLNVALPKFQLHTKINLKPILEKLGVQSLFDKSQANLTGISADLFVNEAVQKSVFEINENGVETEPPTEPAKEERPRPYTKNFIADRPFLFYIKINEYIVFVGRVIDPTKN